MSKSDAHRPEFTVRCACGIEYHTSDTHLGHALPCKCGQTVVIARPAESAKPEPARTRRKKRRFQATESETRRAVHLNSGFRQKGGLVSSFLYPLRFGNLAERGTFLLAVLYLGAMFASWMLLRYGSERTIPGTVIAYGPRFLSLLPLSMLVPAALLFARGALLPLAMAACIGLVPVMGARVSVATLRFSALPAKPAEGTFRVLTFNVQGGRQMGRDLAVMLREQAPDIVLFQECGEYLWKKMRQQTAWHSRRYGSLCTTSRWPVTDVQTMPRDEIVRMSANGRGGTGLVMRTLIQSPMGPLAAINLHLETARRGLEGMLSPEGLIPNDPFELSAPGPEEAQPSASENAARFTANVAVRDRESALASNWAAQTAQQVPVIIGGDFNLPVESTIFRRHWSSFVDAFEAKGNGLGWSKREGRWLRIRIDHLLTTRDGPKPLRVIVGPDFQSDHRPVIADYSWAANTSSQTPR